MLPSGSQGANSCKQPARYGRLVALTLTGERTLPGLAAENYWYRRHEAGYEALLPFCRGAVVLEAGSGEGYGAARVATVARRVIAVDYDEAAVAHSATAYPEISVIRANLARLPVAAGTVEVVIALQVLEHLWDQPGFVAECARVLRPAGTLLVGTPNRLTFPPGNPFHARELSAAELVAVLRPRFDVLRLVGVRHGRRLRRLDRRHGGLVAAQLAAPPDRWPPALAGAVASVHSRDFAVSGRDVDGALDLLAVAVRTPDR